MLIIICYLRGERRFEKPLRRDGGRGGFEEGGAGGRKDYTRSDSDNWRILREEQEEEDGAEPGGSWRIAGGRGEGTFSCCCCCFCFVVVVFFKLVFSLI